MSDWRDDGEAAHAYMLLMQERDEWLRDKQAQAEYEEFIQQQEALYEMER